MSESILPPEPDSSELRRWENDGRRREPPNSDIVYYVSPSGNYTLSVQADDARGGYVIQLYDIHKGDRAISQTIVDDRTLALDVAEQTAAAAPDLNQLDDSPHPGPPQPYYEDVDESDDVPDEWEDEDAWNEALEDAFETAELPPSKGTLTTKTIDGRGYYYLQWREGDSVKSQYVAPVSPASSAKE